MRRLVVSDILKGLRKRKADNDEAVGLIGLCSGAGTTQLGIMLANYFSNGLHLKTAIVSAGFDDSFDRIKEEEQVQPLPVTSTFGSLLAVLKTREFIK